MNPGPLTIKQTCCSVECPVKLRNFFLCVVAVVLFLMER